MSGVDSRIVTMKFDNATFERNARTSLSTLDKLKQSLNFGNIPSTATKAFSGLHSMLGRFGLGNPFTKPTQGLADMQTEANHFTVAPITGGITEISKGFLAMSTVAITALSTVTSKVISTGSQMLKSLTVEPIMGGLREYETNLNSIQTILANTGLEGQEGLDKVNKALAVLNHYSDKTIYNFSEMAHNIGTFTAAGVDLDTSTAAIKGIANLAAVSGSNSVQASTAMYQLSQALAAGRVSLMDWNSVVNAGMGGKVFQEALKETARVHGIAVDNIIKEEGSFRESLQAGWITSEVLTETLSKFTGDLNESQLRSMGYNEEQIKGIIKMGKTATDAATKVKTATQLVDTLKETVGSGWAKTWQLVIGDFDEAKDVWTGVNNALGAILSNSAKTRNKILGDWKELGGRTVLIEAISNAWDALLDVLKPIRQAFRDIFPAKTGEDLYNLTVLLRDFTETLGISDETADNLRRTFRGVFAIFSIAGQIISAVAGQVGRLFGAIGDGSGGFLEFTGGIGDFLVALDQFLQQSGLVENFFDGLGDLIAVPLTILQQLASAFAGLFGGLDTSGPEEIGAAVDGVSAKLQPLENVANKIHDIFTGIMSVITTVGGAVADTVGQIGSAIAGSITPDTFAGALDVINTALIGGMLLAIRNFFNGGLVNIDLGSGLVGQITETFSTLTETLTLMQTQIKANIIMKIAIALGILAASLLVLSTIDPDKLRTALLAMTASFGVLVGTLAAMMKVLGTVGIVQVYVIAGAMTKLAASMLILSLALKVLASMELGDMLRGLFGMSAALFILSKAMLPLAAGSKGMLKASSALILMGVALNVLAVALKIFASMSWEEMARGLVTMAGALAIIVVAMMAMPKDMVLQAAALAILALALNGIGTALKIMGSMSWGEIAKGLVNLAGALTLIAAAMYAMPPTMALQAAGLVLVAVALNGIGAALKIMGGMSWDEIAHGLVALGGALLILAAGLNLMSGAILGAVALTVAAAALAVLTPVLAALGALSWESIIKGLTAIAGLFVVLGLAGLILAPVVPTILALAAALVLIGAGLALAGVGALALTTALAMLVATGAGAAQVVVDMMESFAGSIPILMQAVGAGIIALAGEVANGGPEFVRAFATIIGSALDAIAQNVPKFGTAFLAIINTALRVLRTAYPKFAQAGLTIILGVLRAIESRIGDIAGTAIRIVARFITAIGDNYPKIVDAGAKTIIKLIDGVSKAIDNNSEELGAAGARLGIAIIKGMVKGIQGGIGEIKSAAMDVAKGALDAAKDFLGINSPSKAFEEVGMYSDHGLARGLDAYSHVVNKSAKGVGEKALDTIKMSMRNMGEAVSGNVDMNPVVTPVLDLTRLSQDASRIGTMMGRHSIAADVSYNQARSLAAEAEAIREANRDVEPTSVTKEIKIEQNNYSPKHLSARESYRNMKNAVALAKEDL